MQFNLGACVAGPARLMVAAGKTGGALITCSITRSKAAAAGSSGPASAAAADEHVSDLQCSPACVRRGAHSSRNVTGLAWATTCLPLQTPLHQQTPSEPSAQHAKDQQQQQQQQALLMSSGADKKVRQWRVSVDAGGSGLVEAECPAAWNRPSLEKDSAFDPLGVAVSGNGLVMAVAVDNGTTAMAAVQ